MLEKFIGKKSVLLIPVAWLNTVANLFNNIRSPRGTINAKIQGEGEGASLELDIDPEKAATAMSESLSGVFVKKGDTSLLGEGIVWTQNGLTIDKDWFRQQVIQGEKN